MINPRQDLAFDKIAAKQVAVDEEKNKKPTPDQLPDLESLLEAIRSEEEPGRIQVAQQSTRDQSALVDLANGAKRSGLSNNAADIMLGWGVEVGGLKVLDHRGTDHWIRGDHIHIGPVDHIPVGPW